MSEFLDPVWKKLLPEEEQELYRQPFNQLNTKVAVLLRQSGRDFDEEMLQELRSWLRQKYPEFHTSPSTIDFTSIMYADNMEKILANPHFIPNQISRVKEHLATIYECYKKTNERKLESKAPAIGIDLGFTQCYVAYFNKDSEEVEIIPNNLGEDTTASYVQLNAENKIVVGQMAKDLAHLNPKGTIFDIMRMCGRHFEDEEIQKLKKYWPFQVVQGEDGKIKIRLGEEVLYPEDVSSYTFEPAAAAVAYAVHLQHQGGKLKGLIFDLGRKTFDVAVLELENKKIKILAIDGDPFLGGDDFN
ncbi:unnamed protein product [Allacma fusca]|uniref:Uncharacterized protein n=1 Tax=Allacma fusca TaxID=39272 RepID=A0A8J2KRN6_9HEXA|nr:unnamed protein product [Allacma fusca]